MAADSRDDSERGAEMLEPSKISMNVGTVESTAVQLIETNGNFGFFVDRRIRREISPRVRSKIRARMPSRGEAFAQPLAALGDAGLSAEPIVGKRFHNRLLQAAENASSPGMPARYAGVEPVSSADQRSNGGQRFAGYDQ